MAFRLTNPAVLRLAMENIVTAAIVVDFEEIFILCAFEEAGWNLGLCRSVRQSSTMVFFFRERHKKKILQVADRATWRK